MERERVRAILQRLEDLADNLEKDSKYFRKNVKEIKEELKEEGLL